MLSLSVCHMCMHACVLACVSRCVLCEGVLPGSMMSMGIVLGRRPRCACVLMCTCGAGPCYQGHGVVCCADQAPRHRPRCVLCVCARARSACVSDVCVREGFISVSLVCLCTRVLELECTGCAHRDLGCLPRAFSCTCTCICICVCVCACSHAHVGAAAHIRTHACLMVRCGRCVGP